MFIRKSTHDTVIAAKDKEIAALMKEIAKTGSLLQSASSARDIAIRQNTLLLSENQGLKDQIQPFLDRRAKALRNLRQYQPRGA